MAHETTSLRGVVHGKTVELDREAGLPEGQKVTVVLVPLSAEEKLPVGEGLRRSFGAWADEADGIDQYRGTM